jgi:hypothetical protein
MARGAVLNSAARGSIVGAAIALALAHSRREKYGIPVAAGALLGALGGAWLHSRGGAGRMLAGWVPPPHPIEVMASFNPNASPAAQARAVLTDYYHDDATRSWVDDGAVKSAFGVKQKEDYDPTQLIAAYENKNAPVWRKGGGRMTWAEMDKAVQGAIGRRMKLGALPKPSYDKNPIRIYYYDHDRMKMVEYDRANLQNLLNPNNHYYFRDPSVHTWETQDPAAIERERKGPVKAGEHPGWGGEGFSWDKDVAGQFGSILQSTLQLVGFAMQLTGYAAAVGSALSQASPYLGTLAGMADDAFQGNDNSKAVAAIAKMILTVANKGLGEAIGTELPPVAMQALGQGVDTLGQQIAAGQKEHLDYTGIWTNILKKAQKFHKIGDQEAHVIEKVLGENSAGGMFIKGYQAGKLTDLPTIDAISKMFNNQGNANVWMLGAGLGQLAVRQGAAAPTSRKAAAPIHRSASAHASSGYWAAEESYLPWWG